MSDTKSNNEELDLNREKARLTIRLIRSFEHKNWKPLVVSGVSLNWTTDDLITEINKQLVSSSLRDVFKNYKGYNTLKIEYHPHKAKTNDPLINRSADPSLILKSGLTLETQAIQSGTEISYFNAEDYAKYDSAQE